jgi:hypothetical protein
MNDTARGAAGAGALLVLFSMMLPWYSLAFGGSSVAGKSGWEALGGLGVPVLVLAIAAGWQGLARVHVLLPAVAAAGLAVLVLVQATQVPDFLASTGRPLEDAFTQAIGQAAGLGYERAYGLWTALAGAALALFGSAKRAVDGL